MVELKTDPKVKKKDDYTDLTDILAKLNKEIKKKEEELKPFTNKYLSTKKQKEAFDKKSMQEQIRYLVARDPTGTSGKLWADYKTKLARREALNKELAEKRAKADSKKFKEANAQLAKRRKEFNDIAKEVKELKASIALYSDPQKCQQARIKNRLVLLEQSKSLLAIKQKELRVAAKNIGYAKSELNKAIKQPKQETKKQVKEDSKKANNAKKEIEDIKRSIEVLKRISDEHQEGSPYYIAIQKQIEYRKKKLQALITPKPRKTLTPRIPEAVKKKAKELGKDVQLETLRDSKGNRIYTFQNKDGKYIGVMMSKKKQQLGEFISTEKSSELQACCKDAKDMSKKRNANLAVMIDIIDNRAKLEADLAKGKEKPEATLADVAKSVGSIIQPAPVKDVKIHFTPTVSVVPHIKKSGKASKRNKDIQLIDADGKVFVLTKKMLDKAIKVRNNDYITHDRSVEEAWNGYLKLAQEGTLRPETVASFFKEQANITDNSSKEITDKKEKTTEQPAPAKVEETTKNTTTFTTFKPQNIR